MKRIISVLLALVLSLTLAFSVIACGNSDESQFSCGESVEGGLNGESGSGSNGTDGGDAQVREFDYVYLGGGVTLNGDKSFKTESKIWVDFSDGLDFVLQGKSDEEKGLTEGEKVKEYSEDNIYFLDGYMLERRKEWDGKESKPEKFDDEMSYEYTLEEALQDDEIAARVLSYVIENRGKLGNSGLEDIDLTVDVKEILIGVNNYIQQNKDKTILTLLAEILEVKEEVLEAAVKTVCAKNTDGEPVTIADLFDRLSLVFGVDFKQTFDGLQTSAGLSTEESVAKIKAFEKDNLEDDAYNAIAPILFPNVIEDETLYDYVHRVADSFSIDMIISSIVGKDAPTLEDVGNQVVTVLKTTDLKTFIAYVASSMQLNSPDYLALIDDFVTKCLNNFKVTLKLTVDEYGYPTYFEFAFDLDYDVAVVSHRQFPFNSVDMDMRVAYNIEYANAPFENMKFEFPSDAEYEPFLKYVKYGSKYLTEEQLSDAKKNGFEIEYVNGTGKYADMKLEISSDFDYRNPEYAGEYKGEVLCADATTKIAYIENGKIVLTKEYFEIVDLNDGGYLKICFGGDYDVLFFNCERNYD